MLQNLKSSVTKRSYRMTRKEVEKLVTGKRFLIAVFTLNVGYDKN